ncbi:MAG: cobalamin-binding protein [Chloroflexi bacterium]|nr:cobalamin-binding protein [Chloroflexota bacterium]
MDQNADSQTPRDNLTYHLAELNEEEVLNIVRERIAREENPFSIVEECQEGLRIVGERYEKREYFLSGLIMAGEIFQEVMHLLRPIITEQIQGNELGTILLGTVAGDIHNIGKNVLSMLLTSYGFTVHDLGVDVTAEEFLRAAKETKPDIIALSGLLTSSFDSMKKTVQIIRASDDPTVANIPVVIGGSTVDQEVCLYVSANYWANDAMVGVRLFKELLEEQPE